MVAVGADTVMVCVLCMRVARVSGVVSDIAFQDFAMINYMSSPDFRFMCQVVSISVLGCCSNAAHHRSFVLYIGTVSCNVHSCAVLFQKDSWRVSLVTTVVSEVI